MNLTGRTHLGLKTGRTARSPKKTSPDGRKHMAAVAGLPCVICGAWPVEVHHTISGRYGHRKSSDFETLPLCFNHHRGPEGIHASKRQWEAAHGLDTDYLPVVKKLLGG